MYMYLHSHVDFNLHESRVNRLVERFEVVEDFNLPVSLKKVLLFFVCLFVCLFVLFLFFGFFCNIQV